MSDQVLPTPLDGGGGGGGSSPTYVKTVITTATTYNIGGTDDVVFVGTAISSQTINLPAASAAMLGRVITVKRFAINGINVTVASLGGLVDGQLNRALFNYESITFVCDGSNWWAI